jgi:hypothetical protein
MVSLISVLPSCTGMLGEAIASLNPQIPKYLMTNDRTGDRTALAPTKLSYKHLTIGIYTLPYPVAHGSSRVAVG